MLNVDRLTNRTGARSPAPALGSEAGPGRLPACLGPGGVSQTTTPLQGASS